MRSSHILQALAGLARSSTESNVFRALSRPSVAAAIGRPGLSVRASVAAVSRSNPGMAAMHNRSFASSAARMGVYDDARYAKYQYGLGEVIVRENEQGNKEEVCYPRDDISSSSSILFIPNIQPDKLGQSVYHQH